MSDFLTDLDPVTPAPPALKRYSISEIDTFLRCPARWHYKYVQKLPDPSGPEAQWGIAFHSAVEARYKGEPMPLLAEDQQAAFAVYEAAIASHITPLEGWTERWVRWDLKGIPFHGKIDCVDNQLTVRDTKTKKRRPSADDVHDSLQLTAYWEAVRQTLGERPKAVAWDVLVRNKQPVAETYLSERRERDVDRLTRIVHTVTETIDKGLLFPHWGALGCPQCPYRTTCLNDWA